MIENETKYSRVEISVARMTKRGGIRGKGGRISFASEYTKFSICSFLLQHNLPHKIKHQRILPYIFNFIAWAAYSLPLLPNTPYLCSSIFLLQFICIFILHHHSFIVFFSYGLIFSFFLQFYLKKKKMGEKHGSYFSATHPFPFSKELFFPLLGSFHFFSLLFLLSLFSIWPFPDSNFLAGVF